MVFLFGAKHNFKRGGWWIVSLVGTVFLIDKLTPGINISHLFWPVLIIIVGLVFIFKPKRKWNGQHCKTEWKEKMKNHYTEYTERGNPDDYMESVSIFGGVKKNIISKNFKGGEIVCIFGGFISSDSSSFVFAGSAMLIDESDACKVEGVVFLDSDKSCTKNNGEKGIPKRIVEIKPIGLKIFTDSIGYFSLFLEKGNYSAKLLPYPYYYKTCTDSIAFSFTNKGEKTDTLFLGSYVKDTVFDGSVKITSGNARPGFGISYTLNIGNVGTASQNCTLRVVLDNNFTYSSVSGTAYTRYSSNVMEWDIKPLGVKQTIKLAINGTVKSGTALGTTMKIFASIIATSDANIKNNLDSAVNIVRGSFDPNDKQVFPAGTGTNGFVGTNTKQTLRYHIRFQNTGTDTAFNIVVIDTLSSNVDISSFEEIGASHPYTYELLSGNVLKFTFNNVLLPDSNTNKALSNGYVSFNINPKNGLAVGSKIKNNADM